MPRRPVVRQGLMGAWTEVAAVKVVRSNGILDIFSRQNGQDLLLDWIREVNERSQRKLQ